jgi:hypothetical protein
MDTHTHFLPTHTHSPPGTPRALPLLIAYPRLHAPHQVWRITPRRIDAGQVRGKWAGRVPPSHPSTESASLSHDARGLVSVRRGGGSFDFGITTAPDAAADAESIVIGRVVEGSEVRSGRGGGQKGGQRREFVVGLGRGDALLRPACHPASIHTRFTPLPHPHAILPIPPSSGAGHPRRSPGGVRARPGRGHGILAGESVQLRRGELVLRSGQAAQEAAAGPSNHSLTGGGTGGAVSSAHR